MNMRPRLVVHPIKTSLDGEACQQPVLASVPVAGGHVHGPALVVQAVAGVVVLLVPGLRYAKS